MFTSPSESICNPNFNPLEHGYLDAGHGVVGVARDYGLDENSCAVGRGLDDIALIFIITRILPLGFDADTVADFKGYGDVARDRIVAVHDVITMA
jgi:hypothetical protein